MSTGVDLLVALIGSTAAQSRIHVHVVTRHVQADQALEDNGPPRPCGAQKDQQTRRGAAICHHIQNRAERGRLIEVSGSIAVQCVQQAGHAIKEGAGARMKGHIIEGGNGEHDSGVACKHVRRPRLTIRSPQVLPMRFGANRKTFSLGSLSARRLDLDRLFEGVRFFEGVGTLPFPLWESSLSSAARAAFCRRVRADIVRVKGGNVFETSSAVCQGTGAIRCPDTGWVFRQQTGGGVSWLERVHSLMMVGLQRVARHAQTGLRSRTAPARSCDG